jgi:hypothetical protein
MDVLGRMFAAGAMHVLRRHVRATPPAPSLLATRPRRVAGAVLGLTVAGLIQLLSA